MEMTTDNVTNGDIYSRMAHIPAMVHHHLDSILHCSNGGLLLAASSLTGRNWSGSLWYFDSVQKVPDVESCSAGVELDTGVNDMQLISDVRVLTGTDTGMVQVWELNEADATLTSLHNQHAHDNCVSAVSVGPAAAYAISASFDRSIKLWDLKEMTETQSFVAHFAPVTDVACHPTEPDLFLSCGMDGRLLLWDTRKPKPASIIDISALGSHPTCVAWQPGSSLTFAVGTEGGAVGLFDHSSTTAVPVVIRAHSRFIHRIGFNPRKPNWLASTSDDCLTVVSDFSTKRAMWQSDLHTDFVRGLSWSPSEEETLVTCGWDFRVFAHAVTPLPVEAKPISDDDMDTLPPNPS